MPAGLRRVFAELGTPAETLDCGFVNGFMYTRLRPLVAADRPTKNLPPKFVLRAVGRFHPEFRRRTKAALRTQAERPWRKVVDDWEHGGRALVESRNLAIQKVDLAELDDPTLIEHAQEVIEHCRASWEYHHWLHGYDLGPIGSYLAGVASGVSNPSTRSRCWRERRRRPSIPMHTLTRLRTAVERSGPVPQTLDDVRAIGPTRHTISTSTSSTTAR
jgi:hypothetical protein